MKLAEILGQNDIIFELKSNDKKGILEELAEVICAHENSVKKEEMVNVLLERERLGTTGIGDGVAIPHGKIASLRYPAISFGRSRDGLDFDSIDGRPTHLFFLLVAPENSSDLHLQILARIAKILKSSTFRKRLMEARSKEDIYRIIIEIDNAY